MCLCVCVLKLTTGPGIPRNPSEPGLPGAPWGPTGPVLPCGPWRPDSPYKIMAHTKIFRCSGTVIYSKYNVSPKKALKVFMF